MIVRWTRRVRKKQGSGEEGDILRERWHMLSLGWREGKEKVEAGGGWEHASLTSFCLSNTSRKSIKKRRNSKKINFKRLERECCRPIRSIRSWSPLWKKEKPSLANPGKKIMIMLTSSSSFLFHTWLHQQAWSPPGDCESALIVEATLPYFRFQSTIWRRSRSWRTRSPSGTPARDSVEYTSGRGERNLLYCLRSTYLRFTFGRGEENDKTVRQTI